MILFYAPFPSPDLVKDGWMRRIHAVDQLFKDRERHYAFQLIPKESYDPYDYRVQVEQKEDRAWMHWIDFRFTNHLRHLTELVERARVVYAHTSHSAQYLLPYYRSGKVITDLHGIAPEEERMHQRPNFAAFYESFEAEMVYRSHTLVVVSQAMADHYRSKYPGLQTPFIVLPILNDGIPPNLPERSHSGRFRVVYAGGTQSWQNPDLMMSTIGSSPIDAEFLVFSGDEAGFARLAARHGVAGKVKIAFCPPEKLPSVYAQADFGFVLRDDHPVNRVACPTKLIEYMAHGVIPIVKTEHIGDFHSLGYRYVTLEDFRAGRLPEAAELKLMREQNHAVCKSLHRIFDDSSTKLRQTELPPSRTTPSRCGALFIGDYERTSFYPTSVSCSLTVDGHPEEHVFEDITSHRNSFTVRPKGRGKLQSFSMRIADRPFVCAPFHLEVVASDGIRRMVKPAGGFMIDRYGNWLFPGRGGQVSAKWINLDRVEAVRFDLEIIEVGPELLNPILAPTGWRGLLFSFFSLGAHLKTLARRVLALQ